jgi:hypothetical protein
MPNPLPSPAAIATHNLGRSPYIQAPPTPSNPLATPSSHPQSPCPPRATLLKPACPTLYPRPRLSQATTQGGVFASKPRQHRAAPQYGWQGRREHGLCPRR